MEDYKEKLKLAKKRYNSTNSKEEKEFIETLFPELCEDENIRKGLINMLSQDYELHKKEIAWLEKQAKQNYIDADEDWYSFVRWFVKERTDNYTLIPSDDDIHYWGNIILNHARKLLKKQVEQKSVKCIMEQFSLEKYLENPSRKVVTRDGKPVRIVCWDSPNKAFPVVGFIDNNPTVFVWDYYGYSKTGHVESNCDLFFADENQESPTNKILDDLKNYLENNTREQIERDWKEIQDWYNEKFSQKKEEESLSEFEKAVSEFIQKITHNGNVLPVEDIRGYSKSLLEIAKEELEKTNYIILKDEDEHSSSFGKGFYINKKEGKYQALNIPKWRKVKNGTGFTIPYIDRMINLIIPDREGNGYYIPMKELIENLPREEEEQK